MQTCCYKPVAITFFDLYKTVAITFSLYILLSPKLLGYPTLSSSIPSSLFSSLLFSSLLFSSLTLPKHFPALSHPAGRSQTHTHPLDLDKTALFSPFYLCSHSSLMRSPHCVQVKIELNDVRELKSVREDVIRETRL